MFMDPFFPLVLRVHDRLNLVPHEIVPRIFGDLAKTIATKMQMNPTRLQMKESVAKT
jgi:hypothetical protein